MAAEKDKDLEKFLKDVDDITKLIQELNSEDQAVQEKAFCEADRRIASKPEIELVEGCRTKLNKTSVNTLPCSQMEEMSQDGFLAALEQDARERAERRKENEVLANALKDMGNEAFAKGDYETAVQRYTEGLDRLKDMVVLYTNRAQAHNKLEKYKEAITDCEWALRCNEKCVKAYVHKGKANLGLKDYGEARKCYQKILEIDNKHEKLVKDYLNEVDFQEKKAIQEEKAHKEFALGKETLVSVKELLQKLSKRNQSPAYYAGGIRLLTVTMQNCSERTLFRTCNGFSIIGDNEVISRCLEKDGKDQMEVELCLAAIALWHEVCRDNDENQRLLMTHPGMDRCIFSLLSSGLTDIQKECLDLLVYLSQNQNGRLLLLSHFDPPRLLQCLLGFVVTSDSQARIAIGLLDSVAVEEKFKIHFQTNFSKTALPSFLHVLKNRKRVPPAIVPEFIAVMLSLSLDAGIRLQMSDSEDLWKACLGALDECQLINNNTDCLNTLLALLSLMINMSLESTQAVKGCALEVTGRCLALLSSKNGSILTKAVGVLSRVLLHCPLAVDDAVKGGAVKKLIHFLKGSGQITSGYAVKALAACTRSSPQAREDLVKSDKKFTVLMKLLHSENEVIAGNAALCLGYCMSVPGAPASLLNSDVLKVLLTYAGGDAKEVALQQNAAIALGKLCTAEPRFVEQLRKLNGIEILNSCMKYIELP
ncbi:tetratricopeptide repeat protein 12 isoform X1 [Pleurodeles waltl]|uniref:tetratricopeptide repeat protein 12 isoform X1 n=2 Tax=Pleurodeles waltl TaxID=8319 RepID=UPI00370983E0